MFLNIFHSNNRIQMIILILLGTLFALLAFNALRITTTNRRIVVLSCGYGSSSVTDDEICIATKADGQKIIKQYGFWMSNLIYFLLCPLGLVHIAHYSHGAINALEHDLDRGYIREEIRGCYPNWVILIVYTMAFLFIYSIISTL